MGILVLCFEGILVIWRFPGYFVDFGNILVILKFFNILVILKFLRVALSF